MVMLHRGLLSIRTIRLRHLYVPGAVSIYMARDAVQRYPEECCGVLLGFAQGHVVHAVALPNAEPGDKTRGYLLEPMGFRDVERKADQQGLTIIGVYHSHPDHSAEPSLRDRDGAWPDYVYIILATRGNTVTEVRAWRWNSRKRLFNVPVLSAPD